MNKYALLPVVCFASIGCGGQVVFVEDDDGNGGGGGVSTTAPATSTVGGTTTVAVTSTSGPGGGPGLVEEGLGGQTNAFDFEVGPTDLGVTMVARGTSGFSEVQIDRLVAPSGSTVINGILPSNSYEWLWYGSVAMATPQVQHPETFPLAQGKWHFETSGSTSHSLWRRRTVDGGFHGGVLDVNVFIADNWINEQEAIDALEEAYADWGGIELGDVRYFAIGDEYLVVDEDNLFDLLHETDAVGTKPALNVMVVASIEGQLQGAAGFSVGVPGIGLEPGSNSSAVVWMPTSNFFDPIILRHEAGHFSGLFHTSEFEAGQGDSLNDTPFCSDVLTLQNNCPDYDHIMFPTGGSGAGLFSGQQRTVLQAGALYRGIFQPGDPPMPAYNIVKNGAEAEAHHTAGVADAGAHKVSLRSERAQRRDRTRLKPTLPASLGVGPLAEAELLGLGCVHQNSGVRDHAAHLAELMVGKEDALFAVATDPGQPEYVRSRALFALTQADASVKPALQTLLTSIASDNHESDQLRSAGLRALRRLDTAGAQRLAATLLATKMSAGPLLARAITAAR